MTDDRLTIIDTRTIQDLTVPGLSYRVDITPDDDTDPQTDGDWADEEDIAAWHEDEWRYVGVILTPIIAGIGELPGMRDSLWAVTYNVMPQVVADLDYVVATHPVPDMIKDLRSRLHDALAPVARVLAILSDDKEA